MTTTARNAPRPIKVPFKDDPLLNKFLRTKTKTNTMAIAMVAYAIKMNGVTKLSCNSAESVIAVSPASMILTSQIAPRTDRMSAIIFNILCNIICLCIYEGLLLLVTYKHIYQSDRSIFHIVYDTIDLSDDVVIEDLKNNRNNKTEYGC